MKQIVVLYPVGGVGHVAPMTQLAKIFLGHGYDVTMVLIEPPIKSTDSGAGFIERIAASNPCITFHVLPPIPTPDLASSPKHPFLLILELMRQYNGKLESFLRSIPRPRLHSLVIDLFCTHAIDVATKVGVPVYKFFASGAGTLAVFTQLPALLAGRRTGLKELGDAPLEFLGVPPMPASHLVKPLLEHPEDELCGAMMKILRRNAGTRGVLVNTFESLESRAVQALRDPRCVPGKVLPPVYCVGPLVRGSQRNGEKTERQHECLTWLDAQPERSVVFLCFGSTGTFSADQIKEIAIGLDKSGKRFVWVVRAPGNVNDSKSLLEKPCAGPRCHPTGGFLGANQGSKACRQVMGTAGGCTKPPSYRRIRDPLWMELDNGGHHGRDPNVVLAFICGAEDEQDSYD